MISESLKWIYDDDSAVNCFFRSALTPPYLKVMLQLTTRCNMHCKHCFLSATSQGSDLSYPFFTTHIIKKLAESNVKKVTLTGGEPLLYPNIIDIVSSLNDQNIQTCICTNGSLVSDELLQQLIHLNVHFNVSMDGFSFDSHGVFRELSSSDAYNELLEKILLIGHYKMLNGILTTPNRLSKLNEYPQIFDFAVKAGAKYLLLNPLSPLGRGNSARDLALNSYEMNELRYQLNSYVSQQPDPVTVKIVYIRFPNTENKPMATCSAGLIPYIFTTGDIAICPYMVFAAESPDNDYSPSDFIIGSVYDKESIAQKIQDYRALHPFCQPTKKECLGCAAMKIAQNLSLDSSDPL